MAMFGPTTDHQEIRRWAAMNRAIPVQVSTIIFDGEPVKVGFRLMNGTKGGPEFTRFPGRAFSRFLIS